MVPTLKMETRNRLLNPALPIAIRIIEMPTTACKGKKIQTR